MSDAAAAAGKMHIVTQRMLAKYPFHANIVAAGVIVEERVKTMAVTVRHGVLTFLYDPAFVIATDLDVLVGAILHEIGHVVAGHLTANPDDYPDRRARTIAEEVSVNETITEALPPGVLRIDQYDLPPDEDTDQRYERLAGRTKKARDVQKKRSPGQKRTSRTTKPAKRSNGNGDVQTFDDHSVWNDARRTPDETRDVIDRAVAAAEDQLPDAAKRALPRALRERVLEARRRLGGRTASADVDTSNGVIPWQRILERFGGRRRDGVATYRRAPRRLPALAGIVPSYAYAPSKLRLMTVIDTSGSMERATLAVISAELTALARQHHVTVVQCDDAVRAVAPFSGPVTQIVGRGGTDFHPPFQGEFLSELRPDVIIYFCDGDGPAPMTAPRVPVIWAITDGGRRPAPWGHLVWLRPSEVAAF
jgi:predicted metal-dependent peptidase